jgi:hypothetical protein
MSTDGEDPTEESERRKEEKRRLNEGMKKTRARMGDSSEVVDEAYESTRK